MSKKGNKLLFGVFIGAILGVLFAPRKGDETRKKLSGEGKSLKLKLEKAIQEGLIKYNEVREEVDPVVKKVKKKAGPYLEALKDGLEGEDDSVEISSKK